jgi:arsenate reductase
MSNKIYYLSTCDTCKRIIKEIDAKSYDFEMQDVKAEPITAAQLDALKKEAGSYEALFSKRSQQYKAMGLDNQILTEKDYRKYILEHYTFLKRPVIQYNGRLFIGSDKKVIEELIVEMM